MSVQVNNPGISIRAGAALVARRLVVLAGTYAGVSAVRDWVGVTQEPRASGEYVPVRLTKAGTCVMTADGAIAAGDVVYKGANGKVSLSTTGSIRVGIAMEAAAADGVEFQVLPD